MSWKDKIRAQAAELAEKAQAGVAQGQAKVSEIQAKRRADALLRDLGAAVYAEHRGANSAVERQRLLTALDGHAAEHGPIATEAEADATTTPDMSGGTLDMNAAADPSGDAHTVTGVTPEMPGPAGDNTK